MDTLIGPVPDSWRLVTLREVCDVRSGPSSALKMEKIDLKAPATVPVVTPTCLKENRVTPDGLRKASHESARALSSYRLRAGDVVCARSGHLGRQALVTEEQAGWLFGSTCVRLRPTDMVDSRYLVHYLGHPAIRGWLHRSVTSSAVPSLSAETFRTLPIVLPSKRVQVAIAEVLVALDDKVAIHDQISKTTAQLRDSLLPLLLINPPPLHTDPRSDQ